MDVILQKVEPEVLKSLSDGTSLKSLLSEFALLLLTKIDEETRIHNLSEAENDDNSSLKKQMLDLISKDQRDIYFEQIKQDRCYAAKGCRFKIGSQLYKCSCGDHFVCSAHKSHRCFLDPHKNVPAPSNEPAPENVPAPSNEPAPSNQPAPQNEPVPENELVPKYSVWAPGQLPGKILSLKEGEQESIYLFMTDNGKRVGITQKDLEALKLQLAEQESDL